MNVLTFPQTSINPLKASMLDSAALLLHDCWHHFYDAQMPVSMINEKQLSSFQQYLERHIDNCWLACRDGQFVGIVTVSMNCIGELWVSQKYRGRKIGKRLLDTAMENISKKSYNNAQVGIDSFNQLAVIFFQSHGWKKIGSEFIQFESGLEVEAVVYSKPIQLESSTIYLSYGER